MIIYVLHLHLLSYILFPLFVFCNLVVGLNTVLIITEQLF